MRALLPAQWALPAAAPGSSEHTEPGQAVLPHQASEEAHTRPEVVSAHGQPSQSLSPVGQGLRLSWDVHLGLGTAVGWTMTHRPGPQPYHLGIAACEAQRHAHPLELSRVKAAAPTTPPEAWSDWPWAPRETDPHGLSAPLEVRWENGATQTRGVGISPFVCRTAPPYLAAPYPTCQCWDRVLSSLAPPSLLSDGDRLRGPGM